MSIKEPRVAIAVHSDGHIDPMVYANHIGTFSRWGKEFDIVFLALDGAKVANARNILVENALKANCTHILFIDADHIVDYSLLPCLLGNTDAAVVSGLVSKSDGSRTQVGFINAGEEMSHQVILPTDGYSYFVDVCAFGCTLIDLSVLKLLERPYFKDMTLRSEDGSLFGRRSDVQFCRELREKGVSIKIDTRCIIGHLGKPTVHYPDTRLFQTATYDTAIGFLGQQKDMRVLDLGCGFATHLIDKILPFAKSIVGIDKQEVIDFCKYKSNKIDWAVADLEKYHEFDFKFDVVICADVIEHLQRINGILDTIKDCLSDEGSVVFSTPDVSTIGSKIEPNQDHKQGWNKQEFIDLLSRWFNIVDCKLYPEIVDYQSIVVVCKNKLGEK